MNPQEINRRIAIACGWEHKVQAPTRNGNPLPWLADYWRHPSHHWKWNRHCLPNYYGDLNAIQCAVIRLTRSDYIGWCLELRDIVGNGDDMLTATAAQRAEAFLRTIGQWEDVK